MSFPLSSRHSSSVTHILPTLITYSPPRSSLPTSPSVSNSALLRLPYPASHSPSTPHVRSHALRIRCTSATVLHLRLLLPLTTYLAFPTVGPLTFTFPCL